MISLARENNFSFFETNDTFDIRPTRVGRGGTCRRLGIADGQVDMVVVVTFYWQLFSGSARSHAQHTSALRLEEAFFGSLLFCIIVIYSVIQYNRHVLLLFNTR